MVSSVDGKAAIGGKASRIGSDVDRLVMRNLRASSDAVAVGANTLRAERLSLGLDETFSGPQPMAVILTTTGDVPLRTNLVTQKDQTVLVITPQAIVGHKTARLSEGAEVLGIPAAPNGHPDLAEALRALRRDYAVERLLVEGGPTLNRALISARLVDEIFVTVSPKLLGAAPQHAPTIIEGTLATPEDLHLASVHLANDELFLRYSLGRIPT